MKKHSVLGNTLYYDPRTTLFSLYEIPEERLKGVPTVARDEKENSIRPTSYTFCIDVSDACNLRCDYCFNQSKQGRVVDSKAAIEYLERMFTVFPNGEKYFVDMPGKGEPLLALKQILEIAEWCHAKQDEINKEVLPQFVCNGTLLAKDIATILQKHGILFGVSLDGNLAVHDKHRKDALGKPTYSLILSNVKAIEHREYVGCAATLTKDVFPLLEAIDDLSPIFNTLSFRPARGAFGFDEEAEKLWEKEYDLLAKRLVQNADAGETGLFLRLMNGEDYFGRFLCRAFNNIRVVSRCDASIARFALDIDGLVYPCPALTTFPGAALNISEPIESLECKSDKCYLCDFYPICGGECPAVHAHFADSESPNCLFRKHLILLSAFIAEYAYVHNLAFAKEVSSFVDEKMKRSRADPRLAEYMSANPHLSFTEAKKNFDQLERRY